MIQKMIKYFRTKGARRFTRHLISRLFGVEEMSYSRWRKIHRITRRELNRQKNTGFAVMPKFSVFFLPLQYGSKKQQTMLDSIRSQTYQNWELCINKPINEALAEASGDYFVFLDPVGILAPNALFECVKYRNMQTDFDFLFTDEDQMMSDGKRSFCPQFKSGFNLDLLRSKDYISHFFIIRRAIWEKSGGLRSEFCGAQGYDLVLRCAENSREIVRLPQMLYHKIVERPMNNSYECKRWEEYQKEALREHLKRCGLQANVENGEAPGVYRTCYQLQDEPLVSIIIPNRDHVEDLKRCIESLCCVSSYSNIEIIIVENNSSREDTFEYYKKIQKKYRNLKVLTWKGDREFNYSSLNNFGSKEATGKYLLFLNNDTELIAADSICEMVGCAEREDVGIVGARLYYPDHSIQHAGVIVGLGGVAGHAFREALDGDAGYDERIVCTQDYSAVTAACMLIKAQLFQEVGCFDEKLKVAFNDIDLCLKVRREGKLVVYTPYAELYHYESKSRGMDDTEAKQKQYQKEARYFQRKWHRELEEGDPYYNPSLTLEKHDFSLKVC